MSASDASSGERTCLDDREACAFVEGRATDVELAHALAHIDVCEACAELLSGLLGGASPTTAVTIAGKRARRDAPPRDNAAPEVLDAPAARPSSTAPATLEVRGPYRVLDLMAEGGMGRIYRARDTDLDRDVAIKVPRSKRPALLARFDREVSITARLQHPGVVPIHGAGSLVDGTPFYVMRFIDGTSLDVLIDRATDLASRLALVHRVLDVAETMAFVHGRSIAHRDLKPNNILISQFDETLIIDWGLAKEVVRAAPGAASVRNSALELDAPPTAPSDTPEATEALTRMGDVLGTPAFMAPEQATGSAIDQRVDVFALGGILAMVVTGELPTSDAIRDGCAEAPPALVDVWSRARAFDPDERYLDAGAFAAALRAALATTSAPVSAPPARRWRRRMVVAAAVVAVGAVASVALTLRGRSTTPTPIQATLVGVGSAPSQIRAIAASPSGNRIAYANPERVEVFDLVTGETWRRPGWMTIPSVVEFPSEDKVRYLASTDRAGPIERFDWDLRADTVVSSGGFPFGSHWLGTIASGDVVARGWGLRELVIATADGTIAIPTVGGASVSRIYTSPSRRAFAILDTRSAHAGMIRVLSDDGRELARSAEILDLTALAWFDEATLIYATGSEGDGRIFKARATSDGLQRPTEIIALALRARWIGALVVGGARIIGLASSARAESRVYAVDADRDVALDPGAASALLSWRSPDGYVAWNKTSGELEERSVDGRTLPRPTGIRLRGEPSSATRAGTVLVAALRASGGRRIEAFEEGREVLWAHEPGILEFVRCAGDVQEPCVAGVVTPAGTTELRRIDPRTGALGDLVASAGALVDAAIDPAGRRIAWIDGFDLVERELVDVDGTARQVAKLSGPRTLAFTHDGGLLASIADGEGREIRRFQDGGSRTVLRTQATTITLLRPSPDGAHVGYRTRTYESTFVELRLP